MTFLTENGVGKLVLELPARINYQFQDIGLLRMAVTHASLLAETKTELADNQRLEFLGDAVLQLVLTEELYRRFPEQGEGILTKWRARLVSRPALAEFAQQLDLGSAMFVGKGEEASGGRTRASTLADCLEALFGAIYLDGGYAEAQRVILNLVEERLQKVSEGPEEGNPKGELQEILQAIRPVSPLYQIISSHGPDHNKIFEAAVIWQDQVLGRGNGPSKKLAEANAAADAIKRQAWLTHPQK